MARRRHRISWTQRSSYFYYEVGYTVAKLHWLRQQLWHANRAVVTRRLLTSPKEQHNRDYILDRLDKAGPLTKEDVARWLKRCANIRKIYQRYRFPPDGPYSDEPW